MKENSSFGPDDTQFAWDATSLSMWYTCPRLYYYKMIENWRPRNISVHLTFGTHYAKALERFHKYRADGVDYDEAMIDVVHKILIDTWDSEEGKPLLFLHNTKTRENLVRTIVWYLEQFRDDSLVTYVTAEGKAAVELSFTLPLNQFLWVGHMDRLVRYGDDILVTDNKTTGGTISAFYMKQFHQSIQMSGYTLAGKTLFSIPVSGVVIDAAQIAVGFSRFERGYTFRHGTQLEEFVDEISETIDRARDATLKGKFPMNFTACDKYGGCEFFDICAAPASLRGRLLNAAFTNDQEIWDPLKRR